MRDFLLLVWFSIIESFGYRQLTVLFRLQASWKNLRGDRRWGAMEREGFVTATDYPVDTLEPAGRY